MPGGAAVAVAASDTTTPTSTNPSNPSQPKSPTPQPIYGTVITGKGMPTREIVGYKSEDNTPIVPPSPPTPDKESTIQVTGGSVSSSDRPVSLTETVINKENFSGIKSYAIPDAYKDLVNLGYTIKQPKDMPIDLSLATVGQQLKAYGGTIDNNIRNELGTSGVKLDEQSKTISFPLYEKNALVSEINKQRADIIGPQLGAGSAGPSTKVSESLGSSLGQVATGYAVKDSSGNVIPQYSKEQQASIVQSLANNPEYGNSPQFNKGDINTENSAMALANQKEETTKSSSIPLVNVGGHLIPASLEFVPSQEAIDKANQARQDKANSLLLGQGLTDLSNQQIAQRNQLIEQSNLNAKANYAADLLGYNEAKTRGVNRAGAGLEFTIPPGSEYNPVSFFGIKIANPLLGKGEIPELVGEYIQNQLVSAEALLSSIPARAKTVATEFADILTHGTGASNVPLQEQMYSPFTKEQAGIVASSTYEMPSLIGGAVKAGLGAKKGRLDLSGFSSERGVAVAATGLGLDLATLLLPFERINLVSVSGFKAVTEEGKVVTIAREVAIGYGPLSKTVLSLAERKPFLGEITPHLEQTQLSKIDVGESGIELTTQGKLGTKILTSEEGLGILQKAGKALPRDVESALLSKETAKLIELSSKKVPNEIRIKAEEIPQVPLSTVKAGAESKTVVETIIPKLQPIKGTLSETVQLEEGLINTKGSSIINPKTPEELSAYEQVFGVNTMKGGEPELKGLTGSTIRNETTGDIDVDYADAILGVSRAKKMANFAVTELNKTAESGREFFKVPDIGERIGTNVLVRSKENPKGETVLNILTKHDIEPGYLESYAKKPFDIKLKGLVKVPVKAGSSKVGKFVTIEQNAMNRLESSITLHGPKSEKSLVQPPEYTKGEIQRTESGYTILPHEYRIKDFAKLVSQDLEQISRNLKATGRIKESERLSEIKNKYISLYPEVNFNLTRERVSISETHIPSRFTSVLSSASSRIKEIPIRNLLILKPSIINNKESLTSPSKKSESKPSIMKESESSVSSIKELSKNSPLSPAKESPSKTSPLKPSPSKSPSISPSNIIDSILSPNKPSESKSSLLKSESSLLKSESPSKPSPLSRSPSSPFGESPLSPIIPSSSSFSSHTDTSALTEGFPNKLITGEIDLKTKPDQRRILKKKERYNYLGNAPESQVVGLYNRIETVYGNEKIKKLTGKDFKMTTKGFPKLITSKSHPLVTSKSISSNAKKSKPSLKSKQPKLKI